MGNKRSFPVNSSDLLPTWQNPNLLLIPLNLCLTPHRQDFIAIPFAQKGRDNCLSKLDTFLKKKVV